MKLKRALALAAPAAAACLLCAAAEELHGVATAPTAAGDAASLNCPTRAGSSSANSSCADSGTSATASRPSGSTGSREGVEDVPASTPLVQAAVPIIGTTLQADVYEPGCDAAIYQCDARSDTVSILRFRNSDELYDASPHSERTAPVAANATAHWDSSEDPEVPCRPREPQDRRLAILIHGFLACSQKWHDLSVALSAEGFDVVLPLLPGHGVHPEQQPTPLAHVPDDHPATPVWSHEVGYGTVAKAVAELAAAAVRDLGYSEVLLGGFSAGGTVLTDALMLLAADETVGEEAFGRIRMLHVATFLETPDKVIQLARDLHPLLWLNKLRLEGKWYDIERPSGHPWQLFQDRGRKGLLVLTRSHQMRLLRYITKVRRAFSKIRPNALSPRRRRTARLVAHTPVLAIVLMNDATIMVDLLLDALARHHGADNRLICGLESNHPASEMCSTCCDEEHCSWFDAFDDRHPEHGHLLHTPDCAHVGPETDLSLPEHHACGGSGRPDVYPDGLNHDTILDAQSRAGKPEGWWIPCNRDVIMRFALADRAVVEAMGTAQGAGALPCATSPQCGNLFRMHHTASQGWGKKGRWERVPELDAAAAEAEERAVSEAVAVSA